MKSYLSPVRGKTTSALEENTIKDTLIFGLKEGNIKSNHLGSIQSNVLSGWVRKIICFLKESEI